MECALGKFGDDIKLEGVTDRPERCCHSKGPGQAGEMAQEEPHEGQDVSLQRNSQAPGTTTSTSDRLESSSIEKDLGVLLGTNLTTSHRCVLTAKDVNGLWDASGKALAGRAREMIRPLCSALVRLTK